jgi:hypothetical protein
MSDFAKCGLFHQLPRFFLGLLLIGLLEALGLEAWAILDFEGLREMHRWLYGPTTASQAQIDGTLTIIGLYAVFLGLPLLWRSVHKDVGRHFREMHESDLRIIAYGWQLRCFTLFQAWVKAHPEDWPQQQTKDGGPPDEQPQPALEG